MKTIFTTGQVAKICKVAPRTVSKWFDSGRLKGYRIPGSQDRRIPREHLIKFLNSHGMPLGELAAEVVIFTSDASLKQAAQHINPDVVVTSSSFEVGALINTIKTLIIDMDEADASDIVTQVETEDIELVALASPETSTGAITRIIRKPFTVESLTDCIT